MSSLSFIAKNTSQIWSGLKINWDKSIWVPLEHRQFLWEAVAAEKGSGACRKGRAILGEGFSISKMEKIRIHYLHFTLFPSRALVQIKSVVFAAMGNDQSNLVEEIPPKFLSDVNPREMNLTHFLQKQNTNSCLITTGITNVAKVTVLWNEKHRAQTGNHGYTARAWPPSKAPGRGSIQPVKISSRSSTAHQVSSAVAEQQLLNPQHLLGSFQTGLSPPEAFSGFLGEQLNG